MAECKDRMPWKGIPIPTLSLDGRRCAVHPASGLGVLSPCWADRKWPCWRTHTTVLLGIAFTPCPSQVGSVMSLVSSGDVRYQGVLNHVDMANSRITLVNGEDGQPGCVLAWLRFSEDLFPHGVCLVGVRTWCTAFSMVAHSPYPACSPLLWLGRPPRPGTSGGGHRRSVCVCSVQRYGGCI